MENEVLTQKKAEIREALNQIILYREANGIVVGEVRYTAELKGIMKNALTGKANKHSGKVIDKKVFLDDSNFYIDKNISFCNEYDELAEAIIDIHSLCLETEILLLPVLDAMTVHYVVKRTKKLMQERALKIQECNMFRVSFKKSIKAIEEWRPYQNEFNRLIAEGKKQSWAINKIGDLIEQENEKRKQNKEKLICTKSQKTRPSNKTLYDQLLHRD
jgi:hypothetical protein